MNPPDKCPKCGADLVMQSSGSYFRCGTWATSDGTVDQSRDCTSAQRDALAARVKELEAKNELNVTRELELGAALSRVKELEVERNAWIDYAGRLLAAGNKMRETTTAEVWDNSDKAKQTIL